MSRIPYDYARCGVTSDNENCPLAERCLRRLDPGREKYQSFTAFPGGDDCYAFIGEEQEVAG